MGFTLYGMQSENACAGVLPESRKFMKFDDHGRCAFENSLAASRD